MILMSCLAMTVSACSPTEESVNTENPTPQPEPNPDPENPDPQPAGSHALVVYFPVRIPPKVSPTGL